MTEERIVVSLPLDVANDAITLPTNTVTGQEVQAAIRKALAEREEPKPRWQWKRDGSLLRFGTDVNWLGVFNRGDRITREQAQAMCDVLNGCQHVTSDEGTSYCVVAEQACQERDELRRMLDEESMERADAERTIVELLDEVEHLKADLMDLTAERDKAWTDRNKLRAEVERWKNRSHATVYERTAWRHDIGEHKDSENPYAYCPRCEVEHPNGRVALLRAEVERLRGETPDGWPDGMEMIHAVRRAVGLFDGALPITPKAAWEEALEAIERLRESDGSGGMHHTTSNPASAATIRGKVTHDEPVQDEPVALHATTDARDWARHFMQVVQAGATVDESLMIGWFANAIEVGRSAAEPLQNEPVAWLDTHGNFHLHAEHQQNVWLSCMNGACVPLYTHPAEKTEVIANRSVVEWDDHDLWGMVPVSCEYIGKQVQVILAPEGESE